MELLMEHRGAGVAVRAAYHEERRQEAERLAARLATGRPLEEPAAAAAQY